MDRNELLDEMLRASSPNETSTAIYDARIWLATRADDQRVLAAMEDLIAVERQSLG